jgi:hypothetical protein
MSDKPSSNPDFYSLVGRALVDPDFREMVKDPDRRKDALYAMGIEPSDKAMAAMDNAITAIEDLSSAFGNVNAAS